MINFELDWGLIIVLSISIGLLVAAVVWAVWWFKRMRPELRELRELRDIIKGIAKYLKR